MSDQSKYSFGNVNGTNVAVGDKAWAGDLRPAEGGVGPNTGGPAPQDSPARTGGPDGLSEDEIEALAEAYQSSVTIRVLLIRAGVRPELLPAFGDGVHARNWWTDVGAELRKGRVVGGGKKIMTAAARDYPGNAVFRRAAG
jgi:hypothetical protein